MEYKMLVSKLRRLFLACVSLLVMTPAMAQLSFTEIEESADWDKALNAAEANELLLFVDIYTDWCHWCKVQDESTFSVPAVSEAFEGNYLALKLDAETDFGETFLETYPVEGYPTMMFIDPAGALVKTLVGYHDVNKLMAELADLGNASGALGRLAELKGKVESGDEMTRAEEQELLLLAADFDQTEDFQFMANNFIKETAEADWQQADMMKILLAYTIDLDAAGFPFIRDQKDLIVGQVGMPAYESFIEEMFNEQMYAAITQGNPAIMERIIQELLPLYLDDPAQLPEGAFTTRKIYAAALEDWVLYEETLSNYEDEIEVEDECLYHYNEAYSLFDDSESESAYAFCYEYLKPCLEDQEDADFLILAAYIQGARGLYDEADVHLEAGRKLDLSEEQEEFLDELAGLIAQAREE
ncbi:thioredoxin family protein [Pontibacter sp. G13]|uniref:thioredoxin family protein n=1 Tax=Pontibacter sp. G13 TaxID=3074898 RepID=UPI00288B6E9A|nr:thioredoxin family protein [Pontibacter sp. G13]WNJ20340.1 thioredoxin family protein [Pontibacter sp. G13]